MPGTLRRMIAKKAEFDDGKKQSDSLFESPRAEQLDGLREVARHKRRIVYDCFKAKVFDSTDGVRVRCPHNILAPHHDDGSMDLRTVLRGGGAKVCQDCPLYDDVDDPPVVVETPKAQPKDGYVKVHPPWPMSLTHLRDTRHTGRIVTLCGKLCHKWALIEGDEPVTCGKCLKQWGEEKGDNEGA